MTILQFPRCFRGISCLHPPPPGEHSRRSTIRLIKSDGAVRIYDRPIKALELMEEFPKHMICRSDCFYIGQKTPALALHDRLQPGHSYFLLPANFFQSVLSFASFLRCQSAFTTGRPKPFDVEKTPSGSLRIKVYSEEVIVKHQEGGMDVAQKEVIRVCNTPQLLKEYEQLVRQGRRHWKPKLDTIAEKRIHQQKKETCRKKRN